MNALPQDSARKIHYHIGSFVCPYLSTLVVAAAATTALVVGVLALLHSHDILNCGPIGCIPTEGSYTLLAGSGVLLLAVAVALKVICDRKDKLIKSHASMYDPAWYPAKAPPSTFAIFGNTVFVTQSDGNQEVHHFSPNDELNKYVCSLGDHKVQFCSKLEIETGAEVHFHEKNLEEHRRLQSFVMFLKDFKSWKNKFKDMRQAGKDHELCQLGYISEFGPIHFTDRTIYSVLQIDPSGKKTIHLFMTLDGAQAYMTPDKILLT